MTFHITFLIFFLLRSFPVMFLMSIYIMTLLFSSLIQFYFTLLMIFDRKPHMTLHLTFLVGFFITFSIRILITLLIIYSSLSTITVIS